MAAVLCRGGGDVSLRMYEEWAHTDAILEGSLTQPNPAPFNTMLHCTTLR